MGDCGGGEGAAGGGGWGAATGLPNPSRPPVGGRRGFKRPDKPVVSAGFMNVAVATPSPDSPTSSSSSSIAPPALMISSSSSSSSSMFSSSSASGSANSRSSLADSEGA